MPGFDVEWDSMATLLVLLGCLAGSAWAAWRLFGAVVTRNAKMGEESALAGVAVLIVAFVFFHQQENRPLQYDPGATIFEQDYPAESISFDRPATRPDARQRSAERELQYAREDLEQREREQIERDLLLRTLTSDSR